MPLRNLHFSLTWVWHPPPTWTILKKTADLEKRYIPYHWCCFLFRLAHFLWICFFCLCLQYFLYFVFCFYHYVIVVPTTACNYNIFNCMCTIIFLWFFGFISLESVQWIQKKDKAKQHGKKRINLENRCCQKAPCVDNDISIARNNTFTFYKAIHNGVFHGNRHFGNSVKWKFVSCSFLLKAILFPLDHAKLSKFWNEYLFSFFCKKKWTGGH